MSSGFNVFEPEALSLAEGILDEVWGSMPADVRNGPGADVLRERVARHILAAMSNERTGREELKASVMRSGATDWSQS
jgi:hypothetical protein